MLFNFCFIERKKCLYFRRVHSSSGDGEWLHQGETNHSFLRNIGVLWAVFCKIIRRVRLTNLSPQNNLEDTIYMVREGVLWGSIRKIQSGVVLWSENRKKANKRVPQDRLLQFTFTNGRH